MKFNNSDSLSIVDEINDICNADNNSYPLTSKTRRVNSAMDRFFTLAFEADGRWAFDDINQTTAPLQSINLVSGTEKYAIDTFASEIIKVLRVELLDSAGASWQLTPLDEENIGGASLVQYNIQTGIPINYRLFGKYIYLYPKPNYASTNGLSLYFSRNKSAFTSSDTTKEPGIPSIFHQYICNLASLPFLIEFQKAQKNDIASLVAKDEVAIREYFGKRDEGSRSIMTPKKIDYI